MIMLSPEFTPRRDDVPYIPISEAWDLKPWGRDGRYIFDFTGSDGMFRASLSPDKDRQDLLLVAVIFPVSQRLHGAYLDMRSDESGRRIENLAPAKGSRSRINLEAELKAEVFEVDMSKRVIGERWYFCINVEQGC